MIGFRNVRKTLVRPQFFIAALAPIWMALCVQPIEVGAKDLKVGYVEAMQKRVWSAP